MVVATPELFRMIARPILKAAAHNERDYKTMFGAKPEVCALCWNMMCQSLEQTGAEPKHLLWGLMLMKTYAKEKPLCVLAGGVTRTTFRKWAWLIIPRIAGLRPQVVSSAFMFCNDIFN